MWRTVALGVAAVAVLAGACRAETDGVKGRGDGGRLRVVASFFPLAEAAARVGGDDVAVTNLTPAGVEPHDVELSSKQVDAILDADFVVYLGRGFQPAVADAAKRTSGDAVDVLPAVDPIGRDPHFWLDPTRQLLVAKRVAVAFEAAVPAAKDAIQERFATYAAELTALDGEFEDGLATCQSRTLVVGHEAFGYLGARYHLDVHPVAGLSPESEPDPDRLAEIADLVRREHVTTVFSESLVPADAAQTIARETGAQVEVLDPLEGLTKAQQAAGATYTSVMRDNLAALRKALRCQ